MNRRAEARKILRVSWARLKPCPDCLTKKTMNLTQVMNVTLPEPPAARIRESFPCCSPKMIARDHHEREGHMVHVIIPDGPSHFFRFSKQQFELIKLFDGKRSYAEIARAFAREQKIGVTAEFV